jgi:adenosylcobyric acid synthase
MSKGVIINKFRGDLSVLEPGLKEFSRLTGASVLGVVPYFNFHIQEEDTLPEERGRGHRENGRGRREKAGLAEKLVRIEVIKLPHLSNFTDFDALERETNVSLRYVRPGESLSQAEVYIIPGSKNTLGDLAYLKKSGLARELLKASRNGKMVIGICGGYQMMGKTIIDPGYETGGGKAEGLGLLDSETVFYKEKSTFQVRAKMIRKDLPWFTAEPLEGYEIHMGRTRLRNGASPLFKIEKRGGKKAGLNDGTASGDGRIWGSYIHGLFDNPGLCRRLLGYLGQGNNSCGNFGPFLSQDEELDKLAEVVRRNIDLDAIYKMLGWG